MAALTIHTSWSCCYSLHHLHSQSHLGSSKLTIKSQESPSSSTTPPPEPPSSNKPTTPTGLGFGSSSTTTTTSKGKKQKSNGRAVIRRRDPVGKSGLGLVQEERKASSSDNQQQARNESAFVLTWLALGGVILAQGILLAASGLLPEEWDNFLVKFLYPSFTPTVGLFVAGSVVFGVTKYLQNEKLKD